MKIVADIMGKISMECLCHGNFDKSDAEAAREILLDVTTGVEGMRKKQHPKQEVLIIPLSYDIIVPTIDSTEPNTAVEVYFQCGKDSVEDRVAVDLLVQLMDEPIYNQLRTKEQFGYQVSCGSRWTYGIVGMCFKVVTTCKSADEVSTRIEKFLSDFRSELMKMSRDTFFEHVVSLAKAKLQKFNSLEEETGSLWSEIVDKRYDFEVHRNEVECLKKKSKEDLLQAFDKWLSPNSNKRRKLVIHAIGTSEGAASDGRPILEVGECVSVSNDSLVDAFHKIAGKTWGKIF